MDRVEGVKSEKKSMIGCKKLKNIFIIYFYFKNLYLFIQIKNFTIYNIRI